MIHKYFKYIIASIYIIGSAFVMQESPYTSMKEVETFKANMKKVSQATTSMKCDFVQEKTISFMKDKMISKGKLTYKKPDMLKFEYHTPFQYIMVLNKGKVIIKDNGTTSKFDANSNKLFKTINEMLLSTVQGNVFGTTDFSIVYKENESNYLLEMTPINDQLKSVMKGMKLYIDKKSYQVNTAEMIENSGDKTLFKYSNRQLNSVIPDNEFVVK